MSSAEVFCWGAMSTAPTGEVAPLQAVRARRAYRAFAGYGGGLVVGRTSSEWMPNRLSDERSGERSVRLEVGQLEHAAVGKGYVLLVQREFETDAEEKGATQVLAWGNGEHGQV